MAFEGESAPSSRKTRASGLSRKQRSSQTQAPPTQPQPGGAAAPNKRDLLRVVVNDPPLGHQWVWTSQHQSGARIKCTRCQLGVQQIDKREKIERLLSQPCVGFGDSAIFSRYWQCHQSHSMCYEGVFWRCIRCKRTQHTGAEATSQHLVLPCKARKEPKPKAQPANSEQPPSQAALFFSGARRSDPRPQPQEAPEATGIGLLLLLLDLPRPLLLFPEPGPSFPPNKPWRPQSRLTRKFALVLQVQGSRSFLLQRPRPPSPSLKLLVPNKPVFVLGPPPLPRLPFQALGSPAFSCVLPQLFVFEKPWLMEALVGHGPRSPKDTLGSPGTGTMLLRALGSPGHLMTVRDVAKEKVRRLKVMLAVGTPGQQLRLKVQARAKHKATKVLKAMVHPGQ